MNFYRTFVDKIRGKPQKMSAHGIQKRKIRRKADSRNR